MTIADKIAALPPWADEISLGGLEEDRNYIDLQAALARLALAREWIERPRHLPGCENTGIAAAFCRECEIQILKALEVPK